MKAQHNRPTPVDADWLAKSAQRNHPPQMQSGGAASVFISEADWQAIQERLKHVPKTEAASCTGYGYDDWDEIVLS
jgi:hypothetical protein